MTTLKQKPPPGVMGGGVKVTRKANPLRPIGGVGVPLPKSGDGAGHSRECLNNAERIFDHRAYLVCCLVAPQSNNLRRINGEGCGLSNGFLG
jgi:hypothetical protein